jgi:hypothetical protein
MSHRAQPAKRAWWPLVLLGGYVLAFGDTPAHGSSCGERFASATFRLSNPRRDDLQGFPLQLDVLVTQDGDPRGFELCLWVRNRDALYCESVAVSEVVPDTDAPAGGGS